MTDQLEQELRVRLAREAEVVQPDVLAGEEAIARRLEAGDLAVAEAVGGDPSRRRGGLLAAAAVLVVAVGAAVLAASRDDPDVRTGPVATDPSVPGVPAAVLELRPVLAIGPCTEMGTSAYDWPGDEGTCLSLGDPLPGNQLLRAAGVFASFSGVGEAIDGGGPPSSVSEEAFGVTLTFTRDGIEQINALASQCFARVPMCPTGQLAIVVDGEVLSAPTILRPAFETDEIQISGDFTEQEAEALAASLQPRRGGGAATTTTSEPAADDPTLGDQDDAAKDVAERVALLVFGEEHVTMAADDDGGLTLVTMEGPGGTVLAEVVFDESAGAHRVLRMGPVDGPDHPAAIDPDGALSFTPPVTGELSYVAFRADLTELRRGGAVATAGTPEALGELPAGTRWLAVSVETGDGRVLRWFDSIGGD